MIKKIIASSLILASSSAFSSGYEVITHIDRKEENLTFDHELMKYSMIIDNKYSFKMNVRTDSLSIDMDDLTYRREFNLEDVYRSPGFKTFVDDQIRRYESVNDVKIDFEISHSSGFRFSTSAKNKDLANKAAIDIKNIVEKETQRISKDIFHHINIGDSSYFDYQFAATSSKSLGRSIFLKTRPIVSKIKNPINKLQFYLDFVQKIPYDNGQLSGNYFRTPLAVMMDNKGDCDEKSLLLMVILKEVFPDREISLLVLNNISHAIAVIESENPMSKTFTYRGKHYLPLETTVSLPYGEISKNVKSEIMSGRFKLFNI